jgi:MFS family permease
LKIVPSSGTNLGELGQQQGHASTFDWKWYYSAAGSLIWLALILAIVVPKANRDLRILLILVPLVIVNLLWLAFKAISGMPSSAASGFDTVFHSAAVGVAGLWLVANYLHRFGGFARFFMSFATSVAVACLGVFSYSIELSNETVVMLALLALMALMMLVAITLARKLCGGEYRPVCFMLWLALWTVLGSLVAMLGFIVVGSIIMSGGPDLSEGIMIVVLGGSIIGLCLYVLNLPFMVLGFTNPLFRERLFACLGLKSVPGGPASQSRIEKDTEVASFCEKN